MKIKEKNGKKGCLLDDDTVVVPFEYDVAYKLTDNIIGLKKNGEDWKFIDKDGKFITKENYPDEEIEQPKKHK